MQFKFAYAALHSGWQCFSSHLQYLPYILCALKHYFDEEQCFPCVKRFKAGEAAGDQSEFVSTRLPLPPISVLSLVNLRGRCFGDFFFLLVFQRLWPDPMLMRQWSWHPYLPRCCLLIVKSGLSWGICPGGALYPRLWTCSRRVERDWGWDEPLTLWGALLILLS